MVKLKYFLFFDHFLWYEGCFLITDYSHYLNKLNELLN